MEKKPKTFQCTLLGMRGDKTDLREQCGYLDIFAFAGHPWKPQKQTHWYLFLLSVLSFFEIAFWFTWTLKTMQGD